RLGLLLDRPSPWPLPAMGPLAHSSSPFQMAITAPVWPGKFACGTVLSLAVASVKLFHTRKSRCERPRLPPMVVKAAVVVGIDRALGAVSARPRPVQARSLLVVVFMVAPFTSRPAAAWPARGGRRGWPS